MGARKRVESMVIQAYAQKSGKNITHCFIYLFFFFSDKFMKRQEFLSQVCDMSAISAQLAPQMYFSRQMSAQIGGLPDQMLAPIDT